MKLDEMKRLLTDVSEEAASAADSHDTTWCEDRQTLKEIADSVATILDRLDAEGLEQEAPQEVAMNTAQRTAVIEDFLQWSGGFPPDTVFEVFTYCEGSLPKEYDREEARLVLKDWMDKASQQDPQIENPIHSFKILRHLDKE